MFRKTPAQNSILGGHRFSEKLVLNHDVRARLSRHSNAIVSSGLGVNLFASGNAGQSAARGTAEAISTQ
jgi:hypothetical protein